MEDTFARRTGAGTPVPLGGVGVLSARIKPADFKYVELEAGACQPASADIIATIA